MKKSIAVVGASADRSKFGNKAVRAFYPEAGDIRAYGQRFDPFQNLTAHYLLTGLRVVGT
jgi:hypothetical protein